ncbi:GSCOCT00013086001.2-RA-CDS [Cotesia congregata]|uniref:Cc_bv8.5_27.3 n=2 Tax=root TaxID=1 RepID=S6D2Y4_COTCN|nr:GSCOCT00013086001.2-RA-CDS [Cotesia congregata]CAG5090744.1 cc_bv8.5_27.3 [Cotesia congregata]CAG5092505.1 cc_bv8.5_27.3 [Cotesia congregata]CCB96388.1 hypothetical protein BV8-5 [Bracoviriform congregatae]CCQ71226.1 hypothetical protein BV8-5 [Cotesia congregata]
MCDRLVTWYVNLTDTIAIPAEWPAHVIKKFLVPLAEQVMDAVNAGKPVILQVFNTPAKLVQRQDGNRILYFFEKVFTEELVGSYFIDVVFDMNDENIEAMNDVPRPEPHNPNALEHRISLDGYKIQVYRSEFRATYYLTPTVKR